MTTPDYPSSSGDNRSMFALSVEHIKGMFYRYADALSVNGKELEYPEGETRYKQEGDPEAHYYTYDVPSDIVKEIVFPDDDITVNRAEATYTEPRRIDEYPDDHFSSGVSLAVYGKLKGTNIDVSYDYTLRGGSQLEDDEFSAEVIVQYSEDGRTIGPDFEHDHSYSETDMRRYASLIESLDELWRDMTLDDCEKLEQVLAYIDSHPQVKNPLDSYRDVISSALSQEKYIDYASGEGPLLAEELPDELRDSKQFQEFVATFGWPEVADGAIEPLAPQDQVFDSEAADEFLERFLSQNSLDPSKNLNNFRVWLMNEPHERSLMDGVGMEQLYGAHPALHRLYVLMPDLMEALRELLIDVETRNDGNRRKIAKELSIAANRDIVKSIMLVYEVAGRLLKIDDMRRQQKILMPDGQVTMPDITDAHTALSQ